MFDVCLSFANEDREFVESVYKQLRDKGVATFYDKAFQAELWGEDLTTKLGQIYEKESKFCIIFVSKHYAERAWTNHERQFAMARQLREKGAYILPARLDDTILDGLSPVLGYIDCRKLGVERFADLVVQKVASFPGFSSEQVFLLLAKDQFEEVARRLEAAINTTTNTLTPKERAFALYNLACAQSRRAQAWSGSASFRGTLLNRALKALKAWFIHVEVSALQTRADAVAYVQADDDLLFLRSNRVEKLQPLLGEVKVAPSGFSGGCVTLDALISTPFGLTAARHLKQGDAILSIDPERVRQSKAEIIETNIAEIDQSQAPSLIAINGTLFCTPRQRVYEYTNGWLAAEQLTPGMRVLSRDVEFSEVVTVTKAETKADVVCFLTNHPTHNFFANGYVCHNVKP